MTEAKMTDGWVEWHGGKRPVAKTTPLEVMFADETTEDGVASDWYWYHASGNDDDASANIIAYRLRRPEINNLTQVGDIDVVELKPTIESLAADYRAKLATYEQAKEELMAHHCGVEAALTRLQLADAELGLKIEPNEPNEPNEPKNEPNEPLNITDWRDLRVGDVAECVRPNIAHDTYAGLTGKIIEIDADDECTPLLVEFDNGAAIWCHHVKFIRRP